MAQSGAGPSKPLKRILKNSPECPLHNPECPLHTQHEIDKKASCDNFEAKSILKTSAKNDTKGASKSRCSVTILDEISEIGPSQYTCLCGRKRKKKVSWDESSIQAIQWWYQAQNLSLGFTAMPSLAESDMEVTEQSAGFESDTVKRPDPELDPELGPELDPELDPERDKEPDMNTHSDKEQSSELQKHSQLGDQEDSCRKGPFDLTKAETSSVMSLAETIPQEERRTFEELRRAHQRNGRQELFAHTMNSKEEEEEGDNEEDNANVEHDECPATSCCI